MVALPFADRSDAAQQLAVALASIAGGDAIVLAIPRGGVPIGRIVADHLGAELDVVLVRKLGAPGNPEYAVGAVDEQGHITLEADAMRRGLAASDLRDIAAEQLALLRARRARYGQAHPPSAIAGRTVIVVDDGLATGATLAAALQAVRREHPRRLIAAVPVASREGLATVAPYADAVVCLAEPSPFVAVGMHYRHFPQVSDEAVVALLRARPGQGDRVAPTL